MQNLIADKVFDFLEGKDISGWIKTIGNCSCYYQNDDVLIIRGKVSAALNRKSDPINVTACLCMALFGMHWIFVCPDVLEIVNTKWKQKLGKKTKPKQIKNDWIKSFVEKAIEEGKLFELIFGNGKKLWQCLVSEEEIKKIVKEGINHA